jgi:hypothetical protein
MKLHMTPIGRSRVHGDTDSDRNIEYRVNGMPPGDEAFLGNVGVDHWSILRVAEGKASGWYGDYSSADAALVALQEEFATTDGGLR